MRLFAKFVGKDMAEVVTENIVEFLSQYRRPEELDPLHKGIGTYNQRLAHIIKFFKWFYYPDIAPGERPKALIICCVFRVFRKVYTEWLVTIGTRKRSNRHYCYYDVLLLKLNFAETRVK